MPDGLQKAGIFIVFVFCLHLFPVQGGAGFGLSSLGVVLITDRLPFGVCYAGDSTLIGIGHGGHRLAPGVGLGYGIHAVGGIGSGAPDDIRRISFIILQARCCGIAVCVIIMPGHGAQRAFAFPQQVPALFRFGFAPVISGVQRLPVGGIAGHVVIIVILDGVLLARQGEEAGHVSPAAVLVFLGKLLPVREDIAEIGKVQLVSVDDGHAHPGAVSIPPRKNHIYYCQYTLTIPLSIKSEY